VTGGLARRYARALIELAREGRTLDSTGQELAAAAAAFDEPRLRAVVLNPAVDAEARRRIVAGVVGDEEATARLPLLRKKLSSVRDYVTKIYMGCIH